MMSEELIHTFFEKQLYTFLQKADKEQRESFARGLLLTKEEQAHFQTLCAFVDQGMDEARFYEKLHALQDKGREREVFYFGSPDAEYVHQQSQSYRDMLKGKSVLLRGPAAGPATIPEAFSRTIDCLARLNFDLTVPEAYCKTWSVLHYHCCNGDFSINGFLDSLEPVPNFLCFERGVCARLLKEQCRQYAIPVRDVSIRYRELETVLGVPPSTGLVACYDLLSFDIEGLYLQGFSFFQTPYRSSYRHSEGECVHNGIQECRFIKKLIKEDDRVIADPELVSILKGISL